MRTLSEQQQRRGSAPSTRNTEAWCTSDSQRSPSTTHYRIASILLSSTATDNSAVKHGSVASTIRPNSRLADTSRPGMLSRTQPPYTVLSPFAEPRRDCSGWHSRRHQAQLREDLNLRSEEHTSEL